MQELRETELPNTHEPANASTMARRFISHLNLYVDFCRKNALRAESGSLQQYFPPARRVSGVGALPAPPLDLGMLAGVGPKMVADREQTLDREKARSPLSDREIEEADDRSSTTAKVVHEAIRLEGTEELERPSSSIALVGSRCRADDGMLDARSGAACRPAFPMRHGAISLRASAIAWGSFSSRWGASSYSPRRR